MNEILTLLANIPIETLRAALNNKQTIPEADQFKTLLHKKLVDLRQKSTKKEYSADELSDDLMEEVDEIDDAHLYSPEILDKIDIMSQLYAFGITSDDVSQSQLEAGILWRVIAAKHRETEELMNLCNRHSIDSSLVNILHGHETDKLNRFIQAVNEQLNSNKISASFIKEFADYILKNLPNDPGILNYKKLLLDQFLFIKNIFSYKQIAPKDPDRWRKMNRLYNNVTNNVSQLKNAFSTYQQEIYQLIKDELKENDRVLYDFYAMKAKEDLFIPDIARKDSNLHQYILKHADLKAMVFTKIPCVVEMEKILKDEKTNDVLKLRNCYTQFKAAKPVLEKNMDPLSLKLLKVLKTIFAAFTGDFQKIHSIWDRKDVALAQKAEPLFKKHSPK